MKIQGVGSVNAMHKSTPTASLVSYTEHREPVAVIKEPYKKQQLVLLLLPISSFQKMHTRILFKLTFATILALLLFIAPSTAMDFEDMVKQAMEMEKSPASSKAVGNGGPISDSHPPTADTGAAAPKDINQQPSPSTEDKKATKQQDQQQKPELGSIGKNLKNPNANSKSYGDCLSGCAKIVDSLTKSCKELCDPKKGSCYDECDQNIKTQLDGCKEDCKTQKDA